MPTENWEKRRQVPESDPVYQEDRKEWRKSTDYAFGQGGVSHYDNCIVTHEGIVAQTKGLEEKLDNIEDKESIPAQNLRDAIQQNSESMEALVKEQGEFLRHDFDTLARDLDNILYQPNYKDRKKYLLSNVGKMFHSPDIQDELKEHFGEDLSGFTAPSLITKIRDGSFSEHLLYVAAKHHVENITKQEVALEEIVTETKAAFKEAVVHAVADGLLPKAAEVALSRIDLVTVVLSDRLLSMNSAKLGEITDSGEVRVSNEQLQPELIPRLKKTLYHEFLHEISGKSITVETKIDDRHYTQHTIRHLKSGVSLNKEYSWHSSNRWLNEAITEGLALQLSGYNLDTGEGAYKGSKSYPDERREVDRLLEAGLEKKLVSNAYFENFSSEESVQEGKGKHFANLLKRVNEIEGPGGFNRLENKFILREIEYTLYDHYTLSAEHVQLAERTQQPNEKIFRISMSVGTNEKIAVEKDFIYIARPIHAGSVTISAEEQWKRVEGVLSYIQKFYRGKVSYSFSEE